MNLLYLSAAGFGGLADYAHEQANALYALGVKVTMLAPPAFFRDRKGAYRELPLLDDVEAGTGRGPAMIRKWRMARRILRNQAVLERTIVGERIPRVLFGSYAEYLAPLWAGRLRRLACGGRVVFGAVVHDPVRDYVVGPLWWHRRSVAAGYSFLREAFVHEEIRLDTVRPMPGLRTTVIPHGIYSSPPPTGRNLRAKLSIPESAPVLLSFGHIRDGKNLELLLRAMGGSPGVYLIVAGNAQSAAQKPVSYYQEVAREAGVGERCRWLIRYIHANEIGDLFSLADLVILTYDSAFHSASGVLNLAAHYRKPCLASAGEGSLKSVVQRYGLGVWTEPDSQDALAAGLKEALAALKEPHPPRWDEYHSDNCWRRNAEIVNNRMN